MIYDLLDNAISEIAGVLGSTVDLMHVGNNVDRVVGKISFAALIAGVPAMTASLTIVVIVLNSVGGASGKTPPSLGQ